MRCDNDSLRVDELDDGVGDVARLLAAVIVMMAESKSPAINRSFRGVFGVTMSIGSVSFLLYSSSLYHPSFLTVPPCSSSANLLISVLPVHYRPKPRERYF